MLIVMRNESVARRGCLNKTRKFLFIMARLACVGYQFYIYYISLSMVIPAAWNFNDDNKWTLEDEKERETYSRFNHVVRAITTFMMVLGIYFFIFYITVLMIVLVLHLLKGNINCETVCKYTKLVCGFLKDYYVSMIFNESYFTRVVQRMGLNVADDDFENAETRGEFV